MFIAVPANSPAMSGMQGHILGSLGASGAALVATFVLVLGVRGRHRLKFDHHQAAIWGLIAGTLYAAAVGVWSAPASVTRSLTQAVQGGAGGSVGSGAIALVIVLLIYGVRLKPRTAAFLGVAAATVFAAAGGIWGIGSGILASTLNQVIGVA